MKHNTIIFFKLLFVYFVLLVIQYFAWSFIRFEFIEIEDIKNARHVVRAAICLFNFVLFFILAMIYYSHCEINEQE